MKIEQIEPQHWERLERLFHAALERNSNERDAFLAEACAGDDSLRVAVLSLLSCDTRAANFIEAPVLEVAAQLREEALERSNTEAMSLEPVSLASGGPSLAESESLSTTPIFIGDYRILRKLGEGGMGVVYEAEQQNPRRRVALKVIRGGRLVDKYLVKLFQREAMALARLKHPGIAAIYESDCAEDGRHYFAMELVRGVPLLDYVKGKRLTHAQAPSGVRQRLEMFLKVCDAISYAHQRGVIHRDLKPSNILVTDESEGQSMCGSGSGRGEVKVLDFGLARIIDSDAAGASALSGIGQIKGTLPYMSPEQVRGATDEIDVRADVYALGVILYELLTERHPFEIERVAAPQAARIICEESPKPPGRVLSEKRDREGRKSERIDRDVETIVLKALEKDPERRYQSAAAMADDVTRYLTNQPIQARPPSALYQFRKLVARHKIQFASLTAVFALLLGFAITMAMQSARIARERDRAVAAERAAAEQRDAAEHARNAEREQRNDAEQARNAEQEQRLLAETNLKRAEEQRALAEQQESSNRRLLYAAHMNLAMQAWEGKGMGRMRELVERYIPKSGEEDMRGFEWYYLWRLCHRDLMTLEGHEGDVLSAAFSPDGRRLASGGWDDTVRLWDAVTGQQLAILKGHESIVRSVAYSPNGRMLASGAGDRTVKLWNAATGQELVTLKGNENVVRSVAFSPDGRRLATGSSDSAVKIWDTATGQELITLKGHEGEIFQVAFSPDGKKLASGGRDRTVKLWDAVTGHELITLKGGQSATQTVAFSPDGRRLAMASTDRTVKLWDVGARQALATFKGRTDIIISVVFSPDGKRLATGSADNTVKIWDASTGQELVTLKGHESIVSFLAYSPDGRRLASASVDRTVKLWDAATGQELVTLRGYESSLVSMAFSSDGRRLATIAADGTVKLWDAATEQDVLSRGKR